MLPAATQRLAIAAFALVCLSETLAAAQDASAWDKELHAAGHVPMARR
jgi:hypothetical protein